MRRKVYFYNEKKDCKENETQTLLECYGLKSLNCPPQVKELIQFESDHSSSKKQEAIFKGKAT